MTKNQIAQQIQLLEGRLAAATLDPSVAAELKARHESKKYARSDEIPATRRMCEVVARQESVSKPRKGTDSERVKLERTLTQLQSRAKALGVK